MHGKNVEDYIITDWSIIGVLNVKKRGRFRAEKRDVNLVEAFLNGNLDEMIDNLIAADRAEKLKGDEE